MVDYLDYEEYQSFISSIERERDKLVAQFLYESGCTVSELAELKTSAIRSDGTITFSDRAATISPQLAHTVLKQANAFAFSSRQDESITPKRLQQILKPHLARIRRGKVTPLVLRYTHIVHAYQQGLPLTTICKQTGLTPVRLAQILSNLPTQQVRYVLGRGGQK